MIEILKWVFVLGFIALLIGYALQLLALVCGALYRWFVYPQVDAEQSYRAMREWQREQLRDTPYVAPGRGDPTRPDDDDDDGLSPLVELWRRS